jgi:Protein of unknown function (DUF3800)
MSRFRARRRCPDPGPSDKRPGGYPSPRWPLVSCAPVHLLYVDESGKSGLRDRAQPFYVLGGLIVHDQQWLAMEQDLNARIDVLVPPPRPNTWELHMVEIQNGKGHFKGMPRATCRATR